MKDNKGFTIVELLVSFSITMVIVVFMFQLIINLKDVYLGSGVKTELINRKFLITDKIYNDLLNNTVTKIEGCGSNCVNFTFIDGTMKMFNVDVANSIISYGDYSVKLVTGASFGSITITDDTVNTSGYNYNSVFAMNVPITHKLFDDTDFGINVVFPYNMNNVVSSFSSMSSIEVAYNDESVVVGVGVNKSVPVNISEGTVSYFSANNNIVTVDDAGVITGVANGETFVTAVSNLNPTKRATLNVKVLPPVGTTYDYNTYGAYTLPVLANTTYKLEVWGAEGGGSRLSSNSNSGMGGKGGYSVGTISVESGITMYAYVGGCGGSHPNSISGSYQILGGYNGGGGAYGSSNGEPGNGGGGGTDIRINNTSLYSRVIVAGGGGGGGEDSGDSYGVGGGTSGTSGGGGGATQTAGGSTNATFGQGAFAYDGGGGGGGWYGGGTTSNLSSMPSSANGSDNQGGGGGSGYVYTSSTVSNYPSGCLLNSSYYLTDAQTIAGNTSFSAPGGGTETGHSGDGYARITIMGYN